MLRLKFNRLAVILFGTYIALISTTHCMGEPIQGLKEFSKLSSIAKHETLVQSIKPITVCEDNDCIERQSDLRVALVLVDHGPSTDVSPQFTLYLSMYNSIEEHAVASSLHKIANISELLSSTRQKAGIYGVTYTTYDPEYTQCLKSKFQLTIDARELSAKVRKGKKTKQFEDAVYSDPIHITKSFMQCAGN